MKLREIKWDGKPISKPGMYAGIGIDLYHSQAICVGPSISSSGLRALNPELGSPAHFYADWDGNPKRADQGVKRHFILGRALHHLVLGEPGFAKLFCVEEDEYPDKKGELKPWHNGADYCKKWHAERKADGKIALTQKEVEQLKQMSISLGNHPLVRDGILNGLIERSFFWPDKETGIWLKWRPDAVPTDGADFSDLKTTLSVRMPDLSRTVNEFAYYQQAALGSWACEEILGAKMSSYSYIFVEKQDPWCTRDVRVDEQDMHRGRRMNRATLRIFAKCLKDKKWPGPGAGNEGNERVALSDRARESIDLRLKYEGLADGED